MDTKSKIRFYFKNLWRAITGQTGFYLVTAKPNTWYRITQMDGNNIHGHILTNEDGCFIPFIQVGDEFTLEKSNV